MSWRSIQRPKDYKAIRNQDRFRETVDLIRRNNTSDAENEPAHPANRQPIAI